MSMANGGKKRRAVLIGIENGCVPIVRELVKRGKMPHTAELIAHGVFGEATPIMNTGPNMNWMTIATGAYPGTTGVSCLSTHYSGDPLFRFHSGFFSNACKAEFLWDTAERAGKRSIIIRYPGSWPPTIKQGIQVAGYGHFCSIFEMCKAAKFSTEEIPSQYGGLMRDVHVTLKPAERWRNLPSSTRPPLETVIDAVPELVEADYEAAFDGLNIIKPSFRTSSGKPVEFFVLVTAESGEGYNRVHICRKRDFSTAVATLEPDEWSERVEASFIFEGSEEKGILRFKLMKLSPDASEMSLFMSDVYPNRGWTYPASLASELVREVGPFQEAHRIRMMRNPEIGKEHLLYRWSSGEDLYLDEMRFQGEWLAKTAAYLMKKEDWDLLFISYPNTEISQHVLFPQIDPACPVYNSEKAEKAWELLAEEYGCADRMIGTVLSQCPDDTTVAVVSQHGMVSAFKGVNLQNALVKAGLLAFKTDPKTKESKPDWQQTQATAQREIYVNVNLKGRDPEGIVEPGKEYENVRDNIINTLYSLRDPETGECPIALAVRKEDAALLGLYGDDVGDVVWAFKPPYYGLTSMNWGEGGEPSKDLRVMLGTSASLGAHGQLLPTAKFGLGNIAGLFLMAGPEIKKGSLPRPICTVDIAPTIAYLIGIPSPRDADGRVLHEIIEKA